MYLSAAYQGDILDRLERSYSRMTSERFHMHKILRNEGNLDWPGDFEGRTFLALVQLWNATGKKPEYFEEICDLLVQWTGEKGYFGKVPNPGESDEQQLSGNSWFFRSVCEWYHATKDERALEILRKAAKNLLLDLAPQYDRYPCRKEDRVFEGEAAGSLTGDLIHGWYTSTDIGCAYIAMDGATAIYEVMKTADPELAAALLPTIESMVRNYFKIDFLGIQVQTHATLSGLRAILRFAAVEQRPELVEKVQEVFALYVSYGMSENFENFNWFGRPATWTEPCAVVDSYMVAEQLYTLTGEAEYLNLMQWIYYNGLGFDQRPNGGFGCDSCTGVATPTLSVSNPGLYEAHWCCSMRGGDGLPYVARTAAELTDGVLTLRQLFAGRYEGDGVAFTLETRYPAVGTLTLTLESGSLSAVRVAAVPLTGDFAAAVNGAPVSLRMENGLAIPEAALSAGDTLTITFSLRTEKVAPASKTTPQQFYKFMCGPRILGKRRDGAAEELVPICYIRTLHTKEEVLEEKFRILFED